MREKREKEEIVQEERRENFPFDMKFDDEENDDRNETQPTIFAVNIEDILRDFYQERLPVMKKYGHWSIKFVYPARLKNVCI